MELLIGPAQLGGGASACGGESGGGGGGGSRDLISGDDALLHIAYVMLIWAAPISADRWHCSLWP